MALNVFFEVQGKKWDHFCDFCLTKPHVFVCFFPYMLCNSSCYDFSETNKVLSYEWVIISVSLKVFQNLELFLPEGLLCSRPTRGYQIKNVWISVRPWVCLSDVRCNAPRMATIAGFLQDYNSMLVYFCVFHRALLGGVLSNWFRVRWEHDACDDFGFGRLQDLCKIAWARCWTQ